MSIAHSNPHGALRRILAVALLMTISIALAGCGTSATATPKTSKRPASPAKLTLILPKPNALITTTSMVVQFQLTGAQVVDIYTTHIVPTKGHIHLFIDGRLVSMNYHLTEQVGLSGWAPGPHRLQGEFVAEDHLPFNPPVMSQTIVFEYQPPGSAG